MFTMMYMQLVFTPMSFLLADVPGAETLIES